MSDIQLQAEQSEAEAVEAESSTGGGEGEDEGGAGGPQTCMDDVVCASCCVAMSSEDTAAAHR